MTDKKRPISLKQARELYQYNYNHIEPIGMQDELIDLELPSDEWVVKALKVGYALILSADQKSREADAQALNDSFQSGKVEDNRKKILGRANSFGELGIRKTVKPFRSKFELLFLGSVIVNTLSRVFGTWQFLELIRIALFNIPSILKITFLILFEWKGAPPTVDDLEKILRTPLLEALYKEFLEQGVLGIGETFDNFTAMQDRAELKKLKQEAQQRSMRVLSLEAIEHENEEAQKEASKRFKDGPSLSHLPEYYFTQLNEFLELFPDQNQPENVKNFPLPAIAENLEDDEMFAYMRVAGPNPVWLERVCKNDPILTKFPVTDEQYQAVMGTKDDLERAITEGRLYAVDYALLESVIEGGTFVDSTPEQPEQQKYLYAAMALFAVPDISQSEEQFLRPIAIQCGQDPTTHPILTPASGRYAWLAAKTAVQIADANIHEAITHLARTHLLIEPFIVATHRQLPEAHKVHRLLSHHFEGTILINFGAWKILVAPGHGVNALLSATIDQSRTLAVQGLYMRGFNDEMLPKRIDDRGVGDCKALPIYPYRDDGLALWNAIHEWVDSYIRTYYESDNAVASDEALQNWGAELVSFDGGRVRDFGNDGNGAITSLEYLVDALTLIVFTSSVQHAAVNFPQRGIMSFAPAMPTAGYLPADQIPGIDSEAKYCQLLPPKDMARRQFLILQILGGVYHTQLGDYPSNSFGADVKGAQQAFQQALEEIDSRIDKRNHEFPSKFNYTYLKSYNIPQSINI
ncbi:Lipoxygenase [Synechococcus sp. PCC 7335]|uniref:lipoxygenase family protein n=1 Tax=Synechococcus sp. (strain ATCC 29403 / PCC 7335) TaxID=91464 RepID=UPI00017ECB6B|nr:lipoxygenase family protein [Synechococcus sp. PCC 7335]EDX83314.1 Lipoxygenase [Synechococcus sp. PCC 7335]